MLYLGLMVKFMNEGYGHSHDGYDKDDNNFYVLLILFQNRYEDSCDVTFGYFTNARKRSSSMLFCIFHFWYYWSSTLVWNAETTMLY